MVFEQGDVARSIEFNNGSYTMSLANNKLSTFRELGSSGAV